MMVLICKMVVLDGDDGEGVGVVMVNLVPELSRIISVIGVLLLLSLELIMMMMMFYLNGLLCKNVLKEKSPTLFVGNTTRNRNGIKEETRIIIWTVANSNVDIGSRVQSR